MTVRRVPEACRLPAWRVGEAAQRTSPRHRRAGGRQARERLRHHRRRPHRTDSGARDHGRAVRAGLDVESGRMGRDALHVRSAPGLAGEDDPRVAPAPVVSGVHESPRGRSRRPGRIRQAGVGAASGGDAVHEHRVCLRHGRSARRGHRALSGRCSEAVASRPAERLGGAARMEWPQRHRPAREKDPGRGADLVQQRAQSHRNRLPEIP